MSLPLERMKRLEAGLRDGSLPVAELRAAHTRACETIEKVDELYQHFSTAWLIIGWTLLIFLLNLLLVEDIDWVLRGGVIFWFVSGTTLQGVLNITAAALQGTHQILLRTLMRTNHGLEDGPELALVVHRIKIYQPGMTAIFRAIPINWRFLITISSTVSSAFLLINQLQKAGARQTISHFK